VIATFGVLLAAIYILRLFRRTMFGQPRTEIHIIEAPEFGDLSLRELGALLPLLVLIVWIGVYPAPFLQRTEGAVRSVISAIELPTVSTQPSVIGTRLTEQP
jgi:NADH-quinone oxidoreductase subunit M